MPLSSSTPTTLRAQHRDEAKHFEGLLDRSEEVRGRGLGLAELRAMVSLYRRHAARLARLRDANVDDDQIRYLNALCLRAHTLLHATALRETFTSTHWKLRAADAIRRTWHAQLWAWALLALGMFVGAVLVRRDPGSVALFVPQGLGYSASSIEQLANSQAARADFLAWEASPLDQRAFFGSMLFVHNTRVGLAAFSLGVLAGVPTLLLQIYNGITLGAFAAIFLGDALAWRFLAWILPHGIPELTAITLCAAGGLLLGEAVAVPGRGGRRARLRAVFPSALLLFATAVPLFVLAAFVESFVRQSGLSTTARYAVALVGALITMAIFWTTRRLAHAAPTSSAWMHELIQSDSADRSVPPPTALPTLPTSP